ncbi:hypothetical protein [Devosia sp. LjRoot3]|uniref:hypothetical protein n=1 Tax=Devosia sp. LjRoot3 TaxID=3342319 RepID=UPI003ED15E0D
MPEPRPDIDPRPTPEIIPQPEPSNPQPINPYPPGPEEFPPPDQPIENPTTPDFPSDPGYEPRMSEA